MKAIALAVVLSALVCFAAGVNLLSPRSAFADTVVLNPSGLDAGAGRATVWTTLPTADTWASSLATADGDTSYAHGQNSATLNQNVFLTLDAPPLTSGIINSVTVTALVGSGNTRTLTMRLGIAGPAGAPVLEPTAFTVPASPAGGTAYTTHSYASATGPGGGAWTWADVSTLRAVAQQTARAANGGDRTLHMTQLYATVDYTPTYDITASAGPGGSIAPAGTTTVAAGGSQAYAITPDFGYHVEDVLVDGVSVGAVTSYTFSNVQAPHTISASFALNSYTITTLPGANGSITPSNPSVTHGGSVSVLIVPDPGYHIADVSVDGISQGAIASYTFFDVTAAGHTITATFAPDTYTLTYAAGPGGSISGTATQIVPHGSDGAPVTAVPDAGYHFVSWSDGGATPTRTETNVQADLAVTASFALDTYTISTLPGANGAITPADPTVTHGDDQAFLILPNAGFHVESLTIDGSPVAPATSYTFTNVQAPHTIAATFAINTYTLTFAAGTGGSVSGTTPQTVDHGSDATEVTAVPDAGYAFSQWSDGVLTASRTETNVQADLSVIAQFVASTMHTLTSSAGPGGSITPLGATAVSEGGSQTYTITPNSNYHVADVVVDGSSVGAVSSYTFSNVTAPHTVAVTFAIDTHTLTYTAGTGGSISGTTPQTVDHGTDGTEVTAVPDSGYHFVRWSDGDTAAARTDTNVTSNLAVAATFALDGGVTGETVAPHVATSQDTDACAMCHRAHTSASQAPAFGALETTMNALLVGALTEDEGDVPLCFSCHGIDSLGAMTDVQTAFESRSYHTLTPESSEYGPQNKQCSSCHDSHGTEKTAAGEPFPALLRSRDASDSVVMGGDEYCTSCHDQAIVGAWDGIDIWRQTAHADLTPTASGTNVVCSVCHEPHGSSNTALIRTTLTPPSVDDTVAVPANDRWLCYACHPGDLATFSGGIAYEESTHGSTDATVAITTEWAKRFPAGAEETSRAAGECQVCHAATGRDDGAGKPYPKLQDAISNALCYRCHGVDSTVATDIASLLPTATVGTPEVVATYGATTSTRQFSIAQVYSRESGTTTGLPSPRLAFEGATGSVVAGDIDGDGRAEAVIARPGAAAVAVLRRSALAGLTESSVNLLAEADYLAVGDVLSDTGDLNEVVAVTGSVVRIYRWSGSTLTFVPSGATTVSGTVSGIATGDVLGTNGDEIVVTTHAPDQLYIIDGGSGVLVANGPYATQSLPKGPAVGDLDADAEGRGEIAVAFSGVDSGDVVGVYDATGSMVASGGSAGGGQRRAQRAFIGDVLWGETATGRTGAEIAYTVADPADGSAGSARVDVMVQTATGDVAAPLPYDLSAFSNPAELAAADTNGDGHDELLVACAGSTDQATPPGIAAVKVSADGTALSGDDFYPAAGVEAASDGPGPAWVAVADMGEIGASRHAVGANDAHISTETASFERHVECVDCHNVHEATSTPSPAPFAYGAIKGAWGVSVDNSPAGQITYAAKQRVDFEYELCLKCHSGWSPSADTRNIAKEIDTRNASVHAIEATTTTSEATADSFVPGWGNDSVLHCRDCHGTANVTAPSGPHSSSEAPLLVRPYWGVTASDAGQLCFTCHRSEVYLTGADDGVPASTSRFYNLSGAAGRQALHSWHAQTQKLACSACHVTHGGAVEALLREDVGYTEAVDGNGGSCLNGCHGGVSHAYAPNP